MLLTWHGYGDFNDLPRRIASGKILHDKAKNIAKNPKFNGYQCSLASMPYRIFDEKSSSICAFKIMSSQQLAEELHKLIIKNPEKRIVRSSFIDNIWGADLANI